MKAYFDISGKRLVGQVSKLNTYTCWVTFYRGANTKITVKRHIKKHNVKIGKYYG